MTELMEKGSSFVRDLGDAARENPISAALIGMGILWMFGGSAASVARRARVDRMLDRAGEASEATGSMIRTTGARLGENVSSATRKVQSSASAAIEEATRFGREQIEGANRFGRDQMEEARRFGAEQTDTLGRYAKSLPEYARSIPDYARAIPESGGEMMHTPRVVLAHAGPPGWVQIDMLPGQSAEDFAAHAPAIAQHLGVPEVWIIPLGRSRVRLELPARHLPIPPSAPSPSDRAPRSD